MKKFTLIASVVFLAVVSSAKDVEVNHQPYGYGKLKGDERPWKAPDYSKQSKVLGHSKHAFSVPKGLREHVAFWVKIYSEYSTETGLLHDSKFPHLVYESVDFGKINGDPNLSSRMKVRKKRNLIKIRKKEIEARLKKLQKSTDEKVLLGEDLRFWKLFERVNEKNKFIKASKKGRLRFQLGQSDRFLQGIYFSGRYIEEMEKIFRERGLPIELTRLPFVESSFNLAARSRVGASGIWQFMRSTGRQYMTVNRLVDERNDPILATHSAAKLLRYNYKMLGNWPLAVTAYNYGPAGLRRLVRKMKTKNLVKIINSNRSNRFGFASGNFYASYLAALEVDKNAAKYFRNVTWANAVKYEEVRLSKSIPYQALVKTFAGDKKKSDMLNPHLSRRVKKGHYRIPRRARIRILPGTKVLLDAAIANIKHMDMKKGQKYRVARGDTLSDISQEFGVSVRAIMDINEIRNPRRIRAGQVLHIPKSRRR